MARAAAEASGRPVYTAWDEIAAPRSFDFITYHDVFEHVVDPRAELATARANLRGGGLLVLDVPDNDDPEARHPDMRWKHWRPEQHLWHWSAGTLTRFLAREGWEVRAVDHPIPGKLVVYAADARAPR
jgi:2-polyprenyl-3-methyl-5-hydroxy-6-metoxy-1,4-benzoquinol methylase